MSGFFYGFSFGLIVGSIIGIIALAIVKLADETDEIEPTESGVHPL